MKPTKVSRLVVMGDSLSDRGTMARLPLMYRLSGLKAKSPRGRFTNGFTWSDDICAAYANEFGIRQLKHSRVAPAISQADALLDAPIKPRRRPLLDDTDVADAIIDGEKVVRGVVEHSYTLDNNLRIDYEGEPFARSYAEGGLTAHNWGWSFINSVTLFFSRLILSTLGKKRNELLADDRAQGITQERKDETLVVEWSGANDLITVNKKPTHAAADKAIEARIQNVRELMKNGYKHFVLFNLPDLGLTPRYKGTPGEENARECSQYFNRELEKACKALAAENPYFSLEVFDVSTIFTNIYNDPATYDFSPEKRTIPYTSTPEFIITKDHTSPAEGSMFWDDVHPTAKMHYDLSDALYKKLKSEYNFEQPKVEPSGKIKSNLGEEALVGAFRRAYSRKLDEDKRGYFGFFRRSNIKHHSAGLETILKHALYNGGDRSFKVMQELGWLDDKKNLILDCPALEKALANVRAEHDHQVAPLSLRR